jgi:hypothetical protein
VVSAQLHLDCLKANQLYWHRVSVVSCLTVKANFVSRGVIVVLLTIGITGQLVILWIVRRFGSELTGPLRIAFWTKRLSMLSMLLSGGLSLVATRFETPLDLVFIASLGVWAASSFWIRRARMTIPPNSISESTWSPFQSAEVREICAHVTPTEHARLIDDARERGRKIGEWFAVPVGIVAVVLFWSWRLGLALVALFIVYFAIWVLPRFRAMRRHSIELLCGTDWARAQNYTPTRVRLMTFPWSK